MQLGAVPTGVRFYHVVLLVRLFCDVQRVWDASSQERAISHHFGGSPGLRRTDEGVSVLRRAGLPAGLRAQPDARYPVQRGLRGGRDALPVLRAASKLSVWTSVPE